MAEKGSKIKIDTAIKQFYTIALALKTGPGMKVPEKLLSRAITFEGSTEIVATCWESVVKGLGADKSISFWYRYNRKHFSTDLKFANRELMGNSLERIVGSLSSSLDHNNIPFPINCPPDPTKKQIKEVGVEDVKIEVVAPATKSLAATPKKGTKDSSSKVKATPSNSGAVSKKLVNAKANLAAAEKKKPPPKEESEDSKLKRAWMSDFSLSMALFETRMDKMLYISHCIQFLVPNTQSLKYVAKLDEKKEQMVMALLDIGFELSNSISSQEKVHVDIIMRFCRFYYHFHQWSRLNQSFLFLQGLKLGSDHCWREVQLRVALVNLANSFQTNRKVFFDADAKSQDTLDLHLSDETKQHMGVLCTLICKIMDAGQQDLHQHALFLDSAIVLWSHIEPFFRRVKSTSNIGSPIHETVLNVAQFVHTMFCRIPYFTDVNAIVVGLGIALKLSIIFESLELYEKSVIVLTSCEKNMERAREQNLGTCRSETDCFTADISFMPLDATQKHHVVEESLSLLRREFASYHVDVLCSLYRCKLKVRIFWKEVTVTKFGFL